jgi:cytochrome P450
MSDLGQLRRSYPDLADDEALRYTFVQQPPTQLSPLLRQLRQHTPVRQITLWNGQPAWLVTRYEDVRRALVERALSADATDPGYPSLNPSQVVPNYRGSLPKMEEVRHREIRAMVANKFTVRAVARWRRISQRIVDEQIAALLEGGPPADLITRFALPVPVRMVCHLLGVPARDVSLVERFGKGVIARSFEAGQTAVRECRTYVEDLVRRSEARPGADLVGQLVREQLQPGHLTREELSDLVMVLMLAGHISTSTTIALGVLSLLDDAPLYRAMGADSALVAPFVEELLRFQPIVPDGLARVAKRDVLIGGTLVRAGDAVVLSLASANRDEEAFADPDTFDVQRCDQPRHVAFGRGEHRCLGQHLARMELQIAFAGLAGALPGLRLAVSAEGLRFAHRDRHLPQLYELPVTW